MFNSTENYGKKRLKNVLLIFTVNALIISAVIVCGEFVVLKLIHEPSFPDSTPRPIRINLDRDILYRVKPGSTPEINKQGYRDGDFRKHKSGKKRIVFLGDSFMMGLNVDSEQTMPNQLEEVLGPGVEVFNMGVLGYGPDQSLVDLKKKALSYRPDMIILAIFPTNDFSDLIKNEIFNLDKNKCLQRQKNIVESVWPLSNLQAFFMVNIFKNEEIIKQVDQLKQLFFGDVTDKELIKNTQSAESQKKLNLMRAILREFRIIAEQHEVPFLVTIVPSIQNMCYFGFFKKQQIPPEKFYLLENLVEMTCQQENVENINFYRHFLINPHVQNTCQLYDTNGWHLTPLGNRLGANVIGEYIKAEFPNLLSQ